MYPITKSISILPIDEDIADASLPLQERQRLRFIHTMAGAKNKLQGVEDLWNKVTYCIQYSVWNGRSVDRWPSISQRVQVKEGKKPK